jgi:hypothetical protein
MNSALRPVYVLDHRYSPGSIPPTGYQTEFNVVNDLNEVPTIHSLELAIIATPPSSHTGYVLQLLSRSQCRVLVEKPSATTKEELARLNHLPSNLRRRVFVGYSERFNPATTDARQFILGKVHEQSTISLQFHRARPAAQAGEAAEDPCLELLVHDLDFVINDCLSGLRAELRIKKRPAETCNVVGTIGRLRCEFLAQWTATESISRAHVHFMNRSPEIIDLSSGGAEGRLLALDRQLRYVLDTPVSLDLDRDRRVLEALFCE